LCACENTLSHLQQKPACGDLEPQVPSRSKPGRIAVAPRRRYGLDRNTATGGTMPEIIVYAVEGRSAEQKKGLMKDITDAMVKNFGVKPEVVTVQIIESPKQNKAKGGVPFTER
jgi:4-oxalocrotonate tautomerase